MIEEYLADGNTLLHRLEPKAKIVSCMLFVPAAATTKSYFVALGFIILALILATIARLPFGKALKRLVLVNTFTLFLVITLPLTFGGEQFNLFSWLTLSREGVRTALLIALKTNAILIAIMALLNTSTIAALGHGLEKLGFPSLLCHLLLFSYRYIFVIEQEYRRLLRAAKMRCFSPATTLHTYRTYGYLFGMTLVKSWDQARRVHQAMILRGFNGRFISLSTGSMQPRDYLFTLMVAFYSLSLIIWGSGKW